MLEWIKSYVWLFSLGATLALVIVTLYYTLLNRKMLELAKRPTIILKPTHAYILPPIKWEAIKDDKVILDGRYQFHIIVDIVIIGNSSAQDILLDAKVFFKSRKPLGNQWLPVIFPKHISFITSEVLSSQQNKPVAEIIFDNFVVNEIVQDYFEGLEAWKGIPINATMKELSKDKSLWPSPRIVLSCFYKDIQGIEYCSEFQLFFQFSLDKNKKLALSIQDMGDLNFVRIKKLHSWSRKMYLKISRSRRYLSFWGKKFPTNDIVTIPPIKSFRSDPDIDKEDH